MLGLLARRLHIRATAVRNLRCHADHVARMGADYATTTCLVFEVPPAKAA